mgnify:CR=1 FL=1
MCLLVVGWLAHPRYRVVVAASRDEFHARPTAPMAPWADQPRVLAGRDLQAGGTWIGLDADRRFGLVTNYREDALYRNNGDGTFTEVANEAGVSDPRWGASAARRWASPNR